MLSPWKAVGQPRDGGRAGRGLHGVRAAAIGVDHRRRRRRLLRLDVDRPVTPLAGQHGRLRGRRDALDRRRVAYRQLDDAQLAEGAALGERLLEQGDPLLRELDAQSLLWRGKPQKAHLRRR